MSHFSFLQNCAFLTVSVNNFYSNKKILNDQRLKYKEAEVWFMNKILNI